MNPLDQHDAPPCMPGFQPRLVECSTTNPGSPFASLPKPYVTQLPMLGRPGRPEPVLMKSSAGAWLKRSVTTDLIRQMSSAQEAVWGSRSEISMPHCPCRLNLRSVPRSGDSGLMNAYRWSPTTDLGMGF